MKLNEDFLKKIVLSQLLEDAEEESAPVSTVTRRQIQIEEEQARRWYLNMALRIMSDDKNNAGMNYNWKDMIAVSEQVRVYVEGGVYIDEAKAFDDIPKVEPDSFQTLGA